MIIGKQMLPWENPRTARDWLQPLGYLQDVVLGLLRRDPDERMTMKECVCACKRMLEESTQGHSQDNGSRSVYYAPCPSTFRDG